MGSRYTRELLEEAARETRHIDDAVRWCGGRPTPGSRRYLRRKMAEAGVDISHLATNQVRHTEERLRAAVDVSASVTDVVRHLGLSQVGGNQAHVARRITALGMDTSHFTTARRGAPRGSLGSPLALRPPEAGRIPGRRLRRELLRLGVDERCAQCGTGPVWNDRPLTLEVDHVNGHWWDNRPENLRLLCPNCHAVTDTYRGRKRRRA
ncbi:HNH endonuclease signature motif containing protein [Streptomyces sp. 142MFCol3.1]|uniref:HNH endonuclease signature motif containing protein n=1 Tax=Streptomyces sp. 142MFCol3.1 TaxID=1172179 RepID=UPI0004064717|nr:HNH endonuclease signature motif containing protein [Streptomyces sp. 142MFCol3.1]